MPKKAITRDTYDKLLEGWRLNPGSPTLAAKYAGVDYRTARKIHEQGMPRRGWEPLRTLLEREMQQARASMLASAAAKVAVDEKTREDAAKQAAQARAQEGQMVGLMRQTVLQGAGAAAQLIVTARSLVAYGKEEIEKLLKLPEGDIRRLTASQAVSFAERMARVVDELVSTAHRVMQMERLHLGEPGQIIRMEAPTAMTLEEAELRLEAAKATLDRAKRVGGLRVIDGGLAAPVLGQVVET